MWWAYVQNNYLGIPKGIQKLLSIILSSSNHSSCAPLTISVFHAARLERADGTLVFQWLQMKTAYNHATAQKNNRTNTEWINKFKFQISRKHISSM